MAVVVEEEEEAALAHALALMLTYAMLCYAMLCYAMLCYAVLCCAMLCNAFPSLVKASTRRHTSTIGIYSIYVISNCAFPNRLLYYHPISELGIHFHFRRHNLAFIDTICCDNVSLNKAFKILYRPSL